MIALRNTVAVLGVLACLVSCIAHTNDITLLRTQLPALPEGCPVSVLADQTAPMPVEDLAIVSVRYTPGGRDKAMHELSEKTCYYGGDTVYRIEESDEPNATKLLRARVARRTATPAATPSSTR